MRRLLLLSVVLLGLAGCADPARGEIQAKYRAFSKAYVSHDVETVRGILSPDYTLTDGEGKKITFAEYMTELEEKRDNKVETATYSVIIEQFSRSGDTATVGTLEVSTDPKGVTAGHQYEDVWQEKGGEWRLVSTRTTRHE